MLMLQIILKVTWIMNYIGYDIVNFSDDIYCSIAPVDAHLL